jgi:NAD(P)H-dependent FMN reductase
MNAVRSWSCRARQRPVPIANRNVPSVTSPATNQIAAVKVSIHNWSENVDSHRGAARARATHMMVLGILGSPRAAGNSNTLLEQALAGAASAGARTEVLRVAELAIAGCRSCGYCEDADGCQIQDAMQEVYPRLLSADVILLATPVFFYGVPAQLKALIDRCQACFCKRRREKKLLPHRRVRGRGYLIGVGALKRADLFVGIEPTVRYFFQALDVAYAGALLLKGLEGPNAVREDQSLCQRAFEFGRASARS